MTYVVWSMPNTMAPVVEITSKGLGPILFRKWFEIETEFENSISHLLEANGLKFWHHYRKQKFGNPSKNVYVFYEEKDYQIAKFLI